MTTEAIEKQRREIYEIADAIAPGWERWRARIEEITAPVREWMIQELAPRSGDTVLELAAGAGDTGFEAAAMVGERGRLISTDFSPAMMEVARRRGAELGLGNVDYRVMDAARIELEGDSVDGVLCRFGYMLMPDPAAAFAETRRVLCPGGRLALAVWGAPERNPWASIGFRLLVERGYMPPPESGAPARSRWRARSRRGRCSTARALPPCARRRSRFASPSATSTTTRPMQPTRAGRPRWCSGDCLRTSGRPSRRTSVPRSPPSVQTQATNSRASRSARWPTD
jgi:ubiquinone/menaquinone biosynthesis C-methylase UbiE